MREDGLVHVVIERRRGGGDTAARTDADELLAGLQVPAFLKFVQTRHPDKVPYMFTEKVRHCDSGLGWATTVTATSSMICAQSFNTCLSMCHHVSTCSDPSHRSPPS